MQDKDLVTLCHQGQTDVYARLVQRHQGLIFGLALQFLHSRADAEDVAQETFVRVYRQIEKNGTLEFLPYAKRVASNLCLDYLRRRKAESQFLTRTQPWELMEMATPEQASVDQNERQALRRALASLPPMYREVLVLYYGGELPQQQIARRLGVSLSIVKNRIFRGKRLLKEAYLNPKGGCQDGLHRSETTFRSLSGGQTE